MTDNDSTRSEGPRVPADSEAATAYHEAGHAVIAALLDIEVEYVTVEQTEDALGHMTHLPFADDFRPDIWMDDDDVRVADARITIALAGREAEYLATGVENDEGAAHDYRGAIDLLDYMVGSNKELETELEKLRTRAVELLHERWSLVKLIAEALQQERTLTWVRIRELTEGV